jgi:RNA polymerase sigma factor (sigma-70 family)
MTAADVRRTILAVWRIEQPRLITSLSRMLRDVPLAEDLTQEALLAALEVWPATGVPDKPGAWLMASAKRRALDHLRRRSMLARKHEMLARDMEQEQQEMPHPDADLDDDIGDELLRLIFTACHPHLSREARAALALKMICGLTTDEIARAFLLPEATIAQRIVRAKRTLRESGLAYETPRGEELSERLASVLEVVYLIFNEGYTAAPRRGMAAATALRRRATVGTGAHFNRAQGIRAAWPAGTDGAERLAHRCANRCCR